MARCTARTSPTRASTHQDITHRARRAVAARAGVTVKSIQWTLGAYDLICQFA